MIVVETYSQSTKTQQIVVPSNCAKIHRTKILVPSKQTTQQSAKLWYTHGKPDPTIGPKNNLYWDKTEDILQNIILIPSEQTTPQSSKLWYTHGKPDSKIGQRNKLTLGQKKIYYKTSAQ